MSGVTTRTKPAPVRAVAEIALQLDELRDAPAAAKLAEAPAAVRHEVVLEPLEGRVARARVGEDLVEQLRVGAELAQALRLRRRQAGAEGTGFVRGHGDSPSCGTRAR